MVETGLNREELGKVILAACVVTDLGGIRRRDRNYVTLLMATGLTFGSISVLFGLTHRLVSEAQYSQLLTVIILSAVIPTVIAQRLFQPKGIDVEEEDALGAEDASIVRRG